MAEYLAVKNFWRFQHYSDRNPPWIKLYRELLRDYDFGCLQDASKLHLVMVWLLASELDNKLPADGRHLAKLAGLDSDIDLQPLINHRFLQPWKQSDSKMLAKRQQKARPRVQRTENRVHKEQETTTSSSARERLRSLSREPAKFDAICVSLREGMGLPNMKPATDADIEIAAADWLSGTHETSSVTPRLFRKFVEKAIHDRHTAERIPREAIGSFSRENGKVSKGEQGYINARIAAGLDPIPSPERD